MTARGRRGARGFSLLELLVVIVLISVLLSLAIERLLVMRGQAERAAMDQVVGSLRSAVTIRVAELLATGRMQELNALVGSNPMLRLTDRPDSYAGELFGPDAASLAPGTWYFDTRDRALVYVVENVDYFRASLAGPSRARFAVRPDFEDANRNGAYEPGTDKLRGLRLETLEPYAWQLGVVWPDWPWREPQAPAQQRR